MSFRHCPQPMPYEDLSCKTLESGRTYHSPDGTKYPSITTVLGKTSGFDFSDWKAQVGQVEADRVCHHACTRGNFVHDTAERYLKNVVDYIDPGAMPHTKLLWKAMKPILDGRVNDIVMQEFPLYSDHLKLAGRVDLIARFDGVLSVIDFKTSSTRKKKEDIRSYFLQKAGYAVMFEERTRIPITNLVTLMVVDSDPKPKVFISHRDDWIGELIECVETFNSVQKSESVV